jgi:hypothetical protein
MTEENKTETSQTKGMSKLANLNLGKNIWKITTVVLAVAVIVLGVMVVKPITTNAAQKAVDFLNQNILAGSGTSANLSEVSVSSGILNITVSYQGRELPIYATADGRFLILPGGGLIDMNVEITPPAEPEFNPEKTAKPEAQLYVMAFCPYGMQAEDAMKPVIALLGSKADISVRFIANVGGTTPESVQSLHGPPEAMEDLRQVCIIKDYSQPAYWSYLMTINTNCSSLYQNSTAYDPCWKNAAAKAGIDAFKIEACANSTAGVALLKADADLSEQNGVSGSPTFIVNGAVYQGERTAEGFKAAICSAFTTEPAECSTKLSVTAAATTGGCG